MTATGSAKVWDLADASQHRSSRRRGTDLGGPVAAALGAVALGGAVAPGLSDEGRWTLVVAAGAVAVLVGFSALRRRQALVSLLLALLGLVAPVAAGAVAMDGALRAPRPLTSTVVPDSELDVHADRLVPTAAFASLPDADRAGAEHLATDLVLRLRTMHGSFGPYPSSLVLSNGSVVEGPGVLRGTAVGVVPDGVRLVYEVASSGDSFLVTVVSRTDPAASVAATSALAVPGSG